MPNLEETVRKDFKSRHIGDKFSVSNQYGSKQSLPAFGSAEWIDVPQATTAVAGTLGGGGSHPYFTFDNGTDPSKIFAEGDIVKIDQGSGFIYYYVVGLASSQARVSAGDESNLTSGAITTLQYNRVRRDGTSRFFIDVEDRLEGGNSMTVSPSAGYGVIYMIGSIVFFSGYFTATLGGSADPDIFLEMPVATWDTSFASDIQHMNIAFADEAGTEQAIKAEIVTASGSNPTYGSIQFSKLNSANWGLGSVTIRWDMQFPVFITNFT